uniref:ATP-dependent RNA helicase n=1 Tax=Parastrongyloides trichosuri TaxID=131310 RepID=A0A0N5A1R3_PARTI
MSRYVKNLEKEKRNLALEISRTPRSVRVQLMPLQDDSPLSAEATRSSGCTDISFHPNVTKHCSNSGSSIGSISPDFPNSSTIGLYNKIKIINNESQESSNVTKNDDLTGLSKTKLLTMDSEDLNKITNISLSSENDNMLHDKYTKKSNKKEFQRYEPKFINPNDLINQRKKMSAPADAFLCNSSQMLKISQEHLIEKVIPFLNESDYVEFKDLDLNANILKVLNKMEKIKMTAIQRSICPLIKKEQLNVIATAPTGFGKTYSYLIPVIDNIIKERDQSEEGFYKGRKPLGVIITVTKELAKQLMEEARTFTDDTKLTTVLTFGDVCINETSKQIKSGCDLIIGCIGRLCRLSKNGNLDLSMLRYFVVDEADKFVRDIIFEYDLFDFLEHSKINLKSDNLMRILISATIEEGMLNNLATVFIPNGDYVFIDHSKSRINYNVREEILFTRGLDKYDILRHLLKDLLSKDLESKIIVYVGSKKEMELVETWMNLYSIKNRSCSGNRTQEIRDEAIRTINEVPGTILISTDVTERGIDVRGAKYVIHLNVPTKYNSYINRIGRVGRHGNIQGVSIMFIDEWLETKNNVLSLVRDMEKFEYQIPKKLLEHAYKIEQMKYEINKNCFTRLEMNNNDGDSEWTEELSLKDF